MTDIRYVQTQGTFLTPKRGGKSKDSGSVQKLLGARLHVDPATNVNGTVQATDMRDKKGKSRTGFVEENRLSATQQLKIFYLDVGQGDATLIEAEGGHRRHRWRSQQGISPRTRKASEGATRCG